MKVTPLNKSKADLTQGPKHKRLHWLSAGACDLG